MSDSVVVYTANVGGYDIKRSDIFLYEEDILHNPRMSAKFYKMHPPDNYEYNIWTDCNVILKQNPVDLIDKYLDGYDIALVRHPWRDCVYEEAAICYEERLDYPEKITRTVNFLRSEGYPEKNGLSACTIMLRKNTQEISNVMNMWFDLNNKYSWRDQLTIDYCLWKTKTKLNVINDICDDDWFDNSLFKILPHRKRIKYRSAKYWIEKITKPFVKR